MNKILHIVGYICIVMQWDGKCGRLVSQHLWYRLKYIDNYLLLNSENIHVPQRMSSTYYFDPLTSSTATSKLPFVI